MIDLSTDLFSQENNRKEHDLVNFNKMGRFKTTSRFKFWWKYGERGKPPSKCLIFIWLQPLYG